MKVPILISGQSGVEQGRGGGERTRGSRVLAVTQGLPSPNAHRVPCTVLMVIITMFTEHSPGTRLCFSEVLLFNPPSNPGREVLPFLFTGRLKHMLQVTQLESGQVRFESAADCLASEPALSPSHWAAFLGQGWRGLEGNPGKGNSMGKGVAGKMLDDQ